MSSATSIEWTDATWNPIRARVLREAGPGRTGWHCEKVSPGCANCYAERFNGRGLPNGGTRLSYTKGSRAQVETIVDEDVLREPLRWRKPRRVFVESMSDLFGEWVSDAQLDRVFAVMALARRHTFQVLTKRADRMRAYFAGLKEKGAVARGFNCCDATAQLLGRMLTEAEIEEVSALPNGLPNVWLGVSVEDQQRADERIPRLLDTPAAVRFVSAEPLLGPVDLGLSTATCDCCPRWSSRWVRLHRPVGPDIPMLAGARADHVADCGVYRASSNRHGALSVQTPAGLLGIRPAEFDALPGLDWAIVGGESGPGARPCDVAWIRSIVEQCRAAGTACFVKQIGSKPTTDHRTRPEGEDWTWTSLVRDPKGGDPSEWPDDLRVREFPREEVRSHA